jgi:hypothetical protein
MNEDTIAERGAREKRFSANGGAAPVNGGPAGERIAAAARAARTQKSPPRCRAGFEKR